jgi:alkanesulfonate monooxygenase SsuD/methylene tetrahydromethanopterin reductase-like flavin-dependent oxidoreductase (luciferase family)
VRYAFNLPNYGEFCDVRLLAEIAAAADASGWDGFFIWDHMSPVFAPDMLVPTADTTVALTAIALATERLRFGPMVTPLARRRVHKVAREFASLDRLSDGRAVLGVGLGVPPESEYEAFGEDPSLHARARALDESLDVLTRIWSGDRIDYDGEHLRVHSAPLLPSPVQQPRVPIWIAATWPGGDGPFRRAARYDGVFPLGPDPNEFLTPDEIAAVRAEIGRNDPGFDIVVNPGPNGDPDAFARAGATWWIETYFKADVALRRAQEGPRRSA